MSLNFYLQKIINGESLSEFEAAGACEILLQQQGSSPPAGALLTALHLRGETSDEIVGFAQNLRKRVESLPVDVAPLTEISSSLPATMPIVTLGAALLVASAGGKVAKLMVRGIDASEIDLLPQLGLGNVSTPDETRRQLQTSGVGFINLSQYLPQLRHLRAHQEAIGIPQIFDWIMPLAHPAKISSLLLGIERPGAVVAVAQAMRRLRFDRGFVMAAAEGGACPFSAPGKLVVAELRHGRIMQDEYAAADFGLTIPGNLNATLAGNGVAAQIGWFRAFVDRKPSPLTDAIRWTAACALVAAGRAENLPEAIELVEKTLKADKLAATIARLESASNVRSVA